MSTTLTNNITPSGILIALLVMISCAIAVPVVGQAGEGEPTAQKGFVTAHKAADALIQATSTYDVAALIEIFGTDGKDLVYSADPVRDKSYSEAFAAKAREKSVVTRDPTNRQRAILSVGTDDWPFPVPLIEKNGWWYFDSKEGRDEILYRRIGANELDVIQICRGYVEAQKEYASEVHDNSGVNQYAQKIISTPGKQDGLYWKNPDGTSGGPIGEAVAKAIQEGYSANEGSGYHGYYFKVMHAQGPAAPLGRLDYVIEGIMIGGFALVATPVQYRVTGVKTFIVSYNGIVYEKDLGPDSLNIAKAMELYNPDPTWHRSNDQLAVEASTGD